MKYRRDIDGLRALAVLPIVLFHAGVPGIPGGFVGVDIFFVISGFLITTIITREMAEGRFSLVEFYRRRVVRIVPALFVMLAIVLIVGRLLLLPSELDGLGRSAAAAAAFGSNIYFWKTTGYFQTSAEAKPLLHTWSLGVEEQFYIFFPLLLLGVRHFLPGRLKLVLVLVAIASFLVGVALQVTVPGGGANFYLLPSRAWELALGGLVAIGAISPAASQRARDGLSLLGLMLISVGLIVLHSGSLFPIPGALLPCVGAALLISQGERTLTERWLSVRPMVWVGQLSYSLYLWHWPVIVFYRLTFDPLLTPVATVLLVAVSLGAAAASREFVEKSLLRRFRGGSPGPKVAAGFAMLVSLVLGGIAIAEQLTGSRPIPPEVRRLAAYTDYVHGPAWTYQYRGLPCFPGDGESYDFKRCLTLAADRPNIVVVGDSHAAMYWRAIQLAMPDANVIQATASGCRPVLPAVGADRCTEVVRNALGPLIDTGRVAHVILAGRWKAKDLPSVAPTVRSLIAKHVRVTVIGPTIEYGGDFPQLLARAILRGNPDGTERLLRHEQFQVDRVMSHDVTAAGARYVSALQIECPAGRCRQRAPDGAPIQFDSSHLTMSASRYVIANADL